MNYQAHYDRLIEKYGTWKKPKSVYTERHRKLPGYLGGKYVKGNAFYMTARAHYVAHLMWAKITDHPKAWLVIVRMTGKARNNSKLYQVARAKWAISVTGENSPAKKTEARNKMSAAKKGKPLAFEHRIKIGLSGLGNRNSLGLKHTEESRLKMSVAGKGKPKSEAHKYAIGNSLLGRIPSISQKEKQKLSMTGDKNPAFGTKWITDKISNKRIPKTEDIPDGWTGGKTHKQRNNLI
jgi:hypothetical protein